MGLTRRRFLLAATAAVFARGASAEQWRWRGSALGAEAQIVLGGRREEAEAALAAVVAEIDRLENIFSLHRPASQLCRLNAAGSLNAPARDLVEALAASARWKRLTGGAFDPAVQPLWQYWARGRTGPVSAALDRVRNAEISINNGQIRLSPGTALTLNGIAQGIVSDRVCVLLQQRGFTPRLVDAGEIRLCGSKRRLVDLPQARLGLRLAEAAVATSAPGALAFDAAGRHHLFEPKSGDCPDWWRSVTVIAPTAEAADALSTAFAVLPPEIVGDIASSLDDVAVVATQPDGFVRIFGRNGLYL